MPTKSFARDAITNPGHFSLETLNARVKNGVVLLEGEVLKPATAEDASVLASLIFEKAHFTGWGRVLAELISGRSRLEYTAENLCKIVKISQLVFLANKTTARRLSRFFWNARDGSSTKTKGGTIWIDSEGVVVNGSGKALTFRELAEMIGSQYTPDEINLKFDELSMRRLQGAGEIESTMKTFGLGVTGMMVLAQISEDLLPDIHDNLWFNVASKPVLFDAYVIL